MDDDCQDGLICGLNNCDSGFPGTEYDCCQQPLGDNIYKNPILLRSFDSSFRQIVHKNQFGLCFSSPKIVLLCRAFHYPFHFSDCNEEGSVGAVNNECVCKDNFNGTKCDECAPGYYNFPTCQGDFE